MRNENQDFKVKKMASKVKILSNTLTIQFGGKISTKAEYTTVFEDNKIIFTATKKNNNAFDTGVIELAGCTIRLVENKELKISKAIEILNPLNKIVLNFDYIYIIFQHSKDQMNWFNNLLSCCSETQTETLSEMKTERDLLKILSSENPVSFLKRGWAQIQVTENSKTKSWRYCLLENHILHHFGSKDVIIYFFF